MIYTYQDGKWVLSSWKYFFKDILTIHLKIICFFIGHNYKKLVTVNENVEICLFCGNCKDDN